MDSFIGFSRLFQDDAEIPWNVSGTADSGNNKSPPTGARDNTGSLAVWSLNQRFRCLKAVLPVEALGGWKGEGPSGLVQPLGHQVSLGCGRVTPASTFIFAWFLLCQDSSRWIEGRPDPG